MQRDVQLLGQLAVGGRAEQPAFEPLLRAVQLADPPADAARHPVLGPQLVEDRAADALGGVALEPGAAGRVEALDRVDEAEDAALHEVGELDVGRQAAAHTLGDGPKQRRVVHHQAVAQGHGSASAR